LSQGWDMRKNIVNLALIEHILSVVCNVSHNKIILFVKMRNAR
jgi:hypothetical protein